SLAPTPRGGTGRALKIPLVWSNLVHDRRRTAVGILGVSFSAILLFMQLGFLGSVRSTAKTILDTLDFDILLVSPTYLYLYDAGTVPRIRLEQSRSVAGVREAIPFYVGFNAWTSPPEPEAETTSRGRGRPAPPRASQRAIFILGYNLDEQPFRRASFEAMG